jgi:hypothetical protein
MKRVAGGVSGWVEESGDHPVLFTHPPSSFSQQPIRTPHTHTHKHTYTHRHTYTHTQAFKTARKPTTTNPRNEQQQEEEEDERQRGRAGAEHQQQQHQRRVSASSLSSLGPAGGQRGLGRWASFGGGVVREGREGCGVLWVDGWEWGGGKEAAA